MSFLHLCKREMAKTILASMQLVGYYAAACTVDYRWVGRRRLTVFSFCMVCYSNNATLCIGMLPVPAL